MERKLLIVDDHLVVTTGVSIILQEKFKQMTVSTTDNYNSTLSLLNKNKIDLIILDINIPGGRNTSMIEEIRTIQPEVKILIFSVYDDHTHACPYIIAGANGYLNKLCDKKTLTNAVDSILKTGNYMPANIVFELVKASTNKQGMNPLDKLSPREKEISELLVKGDGNIEISNKLNINLTTVSTRKNKIFHKLHIKNIVELIGLFNQSIGLNN